MSQYLVRVELFGADGENYEILHEKMKLLGFSRTVTFTDGKKYALPIGTYFGSNPSNATQVRDAVRNAANPQSPHKGASVFICQSADWSAWLYED
jgi:hypothetical protein